MAALLLRVPKGSKIGEFLEQSYWAAQIGDQWYSEVDGHEWAEMLTSGLWLELTELWLFGPKVCESDPPGNIGTLVFSPGSGIFPFHSRTEHSQCIARIDHEAGLASFFLWDHSKRKMFYRDSTIRELATDGGQHG